MYDKKCVMIFTIFFQSIFFGQFRVSENIWWSEYCRKRDNVWKKSHPKTHDNFFSQTSKNPCNWSNFRRFNTFLTKSFIEKIIVLSGVFPFQTVYNTMSIFHTQWGRYVSIFKCENFYRKPFYYDMNMHLFYT